MDTNFDTIFRPTVLVSLTTDHGEILKALAQIQIQGQVNLVQTLQTAQVTFPNN